MYNHIRAQIVLANFPCRFGWVNASYILGYKLMDIQMRRAIDLTVHTGSVGFNGFNLKEQKDDGASPPQHRTSTTGEREPLPSRDPFPVHLPDFVSPVPSWDGWLLQTKALPQRAAQKVRNSKQNFGYSKIMLWVAFGRGLRLAGKYCLPCPSRRHQSTSSLPN